MRKEINFRITGAELFEANLNPQDDNLKDNQVFNYDIRLEHKHNISTQTLLVVCKVTIRGQEKAEVYGRYKAGCSFYIENIDEFVKDKEGEIIDIPQDFIITLNSLTISTVRGMMASFYRGTYLHDTILPIVNPALFKENNHGNNRAG